MWIEHISVKPSLPNGSSPPINGSAIIRTPPASSSGGSTPRPTTQQKCNGHKHPHRKHTPSTSMSQQSFKGDASQIQRVAGDGKKIISSFKNISIGSTHNQTVNHLVSIFLFLEHVGHVWKEASTHRTIRKYRAWSYLSATLDRACGFIFMCLMVPSRQRLIILSIRSNISVWWLTHISR